MQSKFQIWFILCLFSQSWYLHEGTYFDKCAITLQTMYDFIIVGGGSSGCVIANRLSEDPKNRVLLLEAGSSDSDVPETAKIETPKLRGSLLFSDIAWRFRTDPQKHVFRSSANNTDFLFGGKVLGGSSAINAAAYLRGSKADFDNWEALGAKGWSYNKVLPFFLKSEGTRIPEFRNSKFHNECGPLVVTSAKETSISDLFFKGATELGLATVDCNEAKPLGICLDQKSISFGQATTASKAFLSKIIGRPNLTVLTKALVTRILINRRSKRAVGVRFTHMGKTRDIRARKEIILSAGTFSSPKILQLSGIGPKELLKRMKIPLISNLPVGQNLQDGLVIFTSMFVDLPTVRIENFTDPEEMAKYLFRREGIYKELSFANILSKTRPIGEPGLADSLLFFRDGTGENTRGLSEEAVKNDETSSGRDGVNVAIHPIHGKSRGFVKIKDRNPATLPQVDPRYFDSPFDFEEMFRGIQIAERLANTPSFREVNAQFEEAIPECKKLKFRSFGFWKCYASYRAFSLGHSVGTCRMGRKNDQRTVVDNRLRIKGVRGLRVADASIMPEVTSGGVYAPVLMIGEKAADMIKEDNTYAGY